MVPLLIKKDMLEILAMFSVLKMENASFVLQIELFVSPVLFLLLGVLLLFIRMKMTLEEVFFILFFIFFKSFFAMKHKLFSQAGTRTLSPPGMQVPGLHVGSLVYQKIQNSHQPQNFETIVFSRKIS